MSQLYYTLLTQIGKSKLANAVALGSKIEITHMAISDGGGATLGIKESDTTLKNERWRGQINSLQADSKNPGWFSAEVILPEDVGGFTMRNCALFDKNGAMFAIGSMPDTIKPLISTGSVSTSTVQMIFGITNEAESGTIQLKIDPYLIVATREWVRTEIERKITDKQDKSTAITRRRFNNSVGLQRAYSSCLSASPLYDVASWQPSHLNKLNKLWASSGSSGLLTKAVASTMQIVMPYMVLIGDSIAEGHPDLHGRLHPTGNAGYNKNYVSEEGQLSYELSKGLNMPVINQGIGSQTSVDIRNRWPRDVLGQVYNPNDGRGSSTLEFGGQKPYAVWLHIGINDVFSSAITLETIKENFQFFAQSCRDNGILLIVDNIGAHSGNTAATIAKTNQVNDFLSNELLAEFPEVALVDYKAWSNEGSADLAYLRPLCFKDNVHPNKAGYSDFADFALSNLDMPVFMKQLVFNATSVGMRFMYIATDLKINTQTFNNNQIVKKLAYKNENVDTPILTITYSQFESHATEVPSNGYYCGFAQIYAEFSTSQ